MARVPRKLNVQPNFAVHKVWRGHNRENNLGADAHKAMYIEFLNDDLESLKFDSGAKLQALTLMSNHSHELFFVADQLKFSGHMRRHHSRYGSYFNRLADRSGKVAEDRPHTTLIADADHEMSVVFYIHANPLRAHIVKDLRNYFWSSHRLYAFGKRESWMRNIKLPNWYLRLGKTPALRQIQYRKLFSRYLLEKGFRKQSFLHRRFYGPLLWVLEKERVVSSWRAARNTDPPI